jgi:hypothetical protein
MSDQTTARRHYEAVRLAQWAIIDAVTAAGHIASRAADCFEGQEEYAAFNEMRKAVGRLASSPEMHAVKNAVLTAREAL